jgi:hypothetical protein
MTCAIAWTTEQIRSMRPLPPPPRDAAAEAADWAARQWRPVTYHDIMRHFEVGRYQAMRLLRQGAERGLLVRHRARQAHTPDEFGPPKKCST